MRYSLFVILSCLAWVFACSRYANMNETDMLSYVRELPEPADRAAGLERFLKTFPSSENVRKVLFETFEAHVDAGSDTKALSVARRYLDSVPYNRRLVETLNTIERLAQKGLALDTCEAWLSPMDSLAKTMAVYYQAACLNTRALIEFHRRHFSAALQLQKDVVAMYGDETEFVRNLAVYEEADGHRMDALYRIVPLALQGDRLSLEHFLTWSSRSGDQTDPLLKDSLARRAVHALVDSVPASRHFILKSQAAVFLARTGVDPDVAERWSNEAVASLQPHDALERVMELKKNHALVLASLGRKEEAMNLYRSITALMDPWQRDDWMMYGHLLEESSQPEQATYAYATALLATSDDELQSAFVRAYTSWRGSRKGSSRVVTDLKDSLSRFTPPHRASRKKADKVILAELFTGADCGPCVSADMAFDALSEYYDRDEVAILEYHLHIPRPDPLTTQDSWERYKYYGGDFGTPTTFFDGVESVGGGGPKFLIGNRFTMYQRTVEKRLTNAAAMSLNLKPGRLGNDIFVDVSMQGVPKNEPFVLHVALVEKSVKYTGSNGINPHAFVVRKLADGASGRALRPGKTNTRHEFNLTQIQADLDAMIDHPHELPSRSSSMTKKPQWKSTPEPLNPANLAVVVWIQNRRTMEVAQAAYADVATP